MKTQNSTSIKSEKPLERSKGSSKPISHSNTFDPNKYMLDLRGKKYLPVAPRIAWMRMEHPKWGITTKVVMKAPKAVVIKATIRDENDRILATARKKETEGGFSDYIEKAETGAIGRALAMCGYGTLQAPEFDEGERLADAPQV